MNFIGVRHMPNYVMLCHADSVMVDSVKSVVFNPLDAALTWARLTASASPI
jgi:hypothetical protein